MGGPVCKSGKEGNCGTTKGRCSVLCEDPFVGIKGWFGLLCEEKGKGMVGKGRFCSLFEEDGILGR